MDIQRAGFNPKSAGADRGHGAHGAKPQTVGLSAGKIRELRDAFEHDSRAMQGTIGSGQHRAMLLAMYEGTENMMDRGLNEFDVVRYLEDLKSTANDLHRRGVGAEQFRTELMRASYESVSSMLANNI